VPWRFSDADKRPNPFKPLPPASEKPAQQATPAYNRTETEKLFRFLEIDPLIKCQAVEMAAQAVKAHFHRAQTYPMFIADDLG
jgi:hypothetical protein